MSIVCYPVGMQLEVGCPRLQAGVRTLRERQIQLKSHVLQDEVRTTVAVSCIAMVDAARAARLEQT